MSKKLPFSEKISSQADLAISSDQDSYLLGPSKLSSFFQPYFSVSRTIKSVLEAFGKDKEDYRAIGTFLVFTADKKETLSNSEYRKVAREVDDIAIGRYEQAQKRGNSMKL